MRRFSLSVGLMLCVIGGTASAQIVQQVNQVRIGGPINLGGNTTEFETQMRIEIDAIQRVTGISDAAAKKLEVAAKAAIKAVNKKQQENAGQFAPQLGFPQAVPAAGGLSDEDAERKAEQTNGNPPAGVFQVNFSGIDEVKGEEIWQKTFSNVLNDDQKQAYKQWASDRATRNRARAVQNYVDQLDSYLLLTDNQRESVTKIVDEKIGQNLAEQQVFNRGGVGNAIIMIAGVAGNNNIDPDDLRDVLSAIQLAELKRQQDQMMGGPIPGIPGMQPAEKEGNRKEELYQSSLGFGVAEESGKLVIREIKPDTPAELAGLQVDDVIDSFNEDPIDTMVQLKRAVSKSNKNWVMQVRRKDNLITIKAPQ
jgi:hypothetical protein